MSAGLTGAASLLQGASQYQAGQAKASLFRANAAVAGAQSQAEQQAGSYNESMQRMKAAALTGQQVAQIGANGLQQRGTPAQVVADTAEVSEMDALQTRNNALRRAWGFQVQEVSDQEQEGLARSAGNFNAAGSLLSGGARADNQATQAGTWI